MPETAESHMYSLTANRTCVIEITNGSVYYCLYNSKVYMESGFVFSPPQPTLCTQKTEVCSFTKDDNTASGAVGVMTYELFHMQRREREGMMAVMFSVPFDYNFYSNWLSVGIFDPLQPCDKALYEKMYNDKCESFRRHKGDGSGTRFEGKKVDIRGCMSDEGKAIVKLEIYDRCWAQEPLF